MEWHVAGGPNLAQFWVDATTKGHPLSKKIVDLATWPRAAQFHHFRTYERPHYAVTARVDVTGVMAAKGAGLSPNRAFLYAIGAGLDAVDELRMRFQGDVVTLDDDFAVSLPVPNRQGSFVYADVPWQRDFAAFDADCAQRLETAAQSEGLNANYQGDRAVVYVSCLPWMDYTSLTNAMPGPEDCIPRVAWGKFVDHGGRWDTAMTLEVHHALVDGAQVGAYFAAVQTALDLIPTL